MARSGWLLKGHWGALKFEVWGLGVGLLGRGSLIISDVRYHLCAVFCLFSVSRAEAQRREDEAAVLICELVDEFCRKSGLEVWAGSLGWKSGLDESCGDRFVGKLILVAGRRLESMLGRMLPGNPQVMSRPAWGTRSAKMTWRNPDMERLLLLLAISFQAAEIDQTVASKVIDGVVIEVEAVESHLSADRSLQMLEMKVKGVGLGAEALQGKSIKAKYGLGRAARLRPFMGFEPRSGEPISKGRKMVVYIRWLGTNREPTIMDAWAEGEKKSFEDGKELIAQLKDVNEAKTEEELPDRFFYTLLKKNEASEFIWRHMGFGLRFSRKEMLTSLLNRVAESEKLPEDKRNPLKEVLRRNQPAWDASDERRHELILRITSGDQREEIVPATISFANAIQNQKEAKVAENWCDNLCGVALEMEERSKEEAAAFIEAIQGVVNTGFWTQPFNNHRHLIWKAAFRMAAESKQKEVKRAWEDMLVEQTSKAKPFLKEDVLGRLKDIKDPTFRERLRNAATLETKSDVEPRKKPE